MAGRWVDTTLGDVLTLQRGFDLPETDREPGRYPVVASTGPVGTHVEAAVKGPGVVIGRSGSLGGGQFIAGDFWPLNTTLWVKDFKGNDRRFCYYLLKSLDLAHFNAGSGVPTLNRNHIHPLPLSVPIDPNEQRAIAHILGTLDDKIELNRRTNETLEAIARALFKSWFVDFDPVRAKSEGRDTGLPPHLADLFPDSFEDSEVGEIPKGWRVAPLSDCVDVRRGLSYKGSGLSKDGLPMHNLNSIYEGGGYKHDGLKHYEGDYKPRHVAHAGDLIVANTEQGHHRMLIGYAAIVPTSFEGQSLFSHHIYRVCTKSSSRLTPDYLCHLLNSGAMHDTVSGYANGTTVNMLPMDGLQTPLVVVPPARVVTAFNNIAEIARKQHEGMVEGTRSLAALRNALLSKLISGELRVEGAGRLAAGVGE
jgi:type I restriction enzyme S subunit